MDRAAVEFLKAAARRPLGVATVFPTSRALAERIVEEAAAGPPGGVLELGAGTGAITRHLVGAVRTCLVGASVRLNLLEWLALLHLLRQPRRRLAHVKLAGDHIGDQAGAVFAEEADLILRNSNATLAAARLIPDVTYDRLLLLDRRHRDRTRCG